MSASEKLKALGEDDSYGGWNLMGVLPQIVAVVEAAEQAAIEDADSCVRIVRALDALDEQLGGELET